MRKYRTDLITWSGVRVKPDAGNAKYFLARTGIPRDEPVWALWVLRSFGWYMLRLGYAHEMPDYIREDQRRAP